VIPRFARTVIVAASACVVLAACTPTPAATTVPLPAKDRAAWTLPLTQYLPHNWEPADYASTLLAADCMAKAGYSWKPPVETIDPPGGESWNVGGRKLFNPELAEKYGYGNSPMTVVPEQETAAQRRFDESSVSIGQAGADQLGACLHQGRKQLGWVADPTSYAQDLSLAARPSRADEAAVKAASKRWRACMRSAAVPDLPSDPNEMPSPSVDSSSGIDVIDRTASAHERQVAVQDAKCQESSGWAEAEYRAEWNAEVPLFQENADRLERYQRIRDRQAEEAMQIIAEHPVAG